MELIEWYKNISAEWQTTLFAGLLSIIGGIVLLYFRYYHSRTTPNKPVLTHAQDNDNIALSDIETKKFEIESYWGYRPSAHNDMKKSLLSCKQQIFIAGIGLNTIIDVLNDPKIISGLSCQLTNNPNFSITIVMESKRKTKVTKEAGRHRRNEKKKRGFDAISRFYGLLSKEVPKNILRPLVKVRTYSEYVQPHHFILSVDEVIYIGSYLSHKQGSYSYLIKIRQKGDGLHKLLTKEVEYIKEYSNPYAIESLDKTDEEFL